MMNLGKLASRAALVALALSSIPASSHPIAEAPDCPVFPRGQSLESACRRSAGSRQFRCAYPQHRIGHRPSPRLRCR